MCYLALRLIDRIENRFEHEKCVQVLENCLVRIVRSFEWIVTTSVYWHILNSIFFILNLILTHYKYSTNIAYKSKSNKYKSDKIHVNSYIKPYAIKS